MIEVVPFADVADIYHLADNFSGFLRLTANGDIAIEFPKLYENYTSKDVVTNMLDSKSRCEAGKREQFIGYYGRFAVGLSHVGIEPSTPEGIDNDIANLSAFVLHPFREKGIGGRLTMVAMETIEARFNGQAWTTIHPDNLASQNMVARAGFLLQGNTELDDCSRLLYTYGLEL